MKEFTFPAWCRYGKLDSNESLVDVELTDEEAERLVTYGTDGEVYYDGFYECAALKDIYKKVYDIANAQITEELRFWMAEEEEDSEISKLPNWKASDHYSIGVEFPTEFEEIINSKYEEEGTD